MNAAQATKAIKRIIGKNGFLKHDPRAPDAAEREAAKARLPDLIAAQKVAEELAEARRREVLKDPEYVALRDEAVRLRKERERTSGVARWFRVEACHSMGIGYSVKASGDTFAEVVEKLENGRLSP